MFCIAPLFVIVSFSLQFFPLPFLFLFFHSKTKMDWCEVRIESRRCSFQHISVPFLSYSPKYFSGMHGVGEQTLLSKQALEAACCLHDPGTLFSRLCSQGICLRLLLQIRTNVEWLAIERRSCLQRWIKYQVGKRRALGSFPDMIFVTTSIPFYLGVKVNDLKRVFTHLFHFTKGSYC